MRKKRDKKEYKADRELLNEMEKLKAENEYLKKLYALIREK